MLEELDEIQREIFEKYKSALVAVGVDFEREQVVSALVDCFEGLEGVLQSVISYWVYRKEQNETLEEPNTFLLKAIANRWTPYIWDEKWLDLPELQHRGLRWYSAAILRWGSEMVAQLVTDVNLTHITFVSGTTLSIDSCQNWGWERTFEYALSQLPSNHLLRQPSFSVVNN